MQWFRMLPLDANDELLVVQVLLCNLKEPLPKENDGLVAVARIEKDYNAYK